MVKIELERKGAFGLVHVVVEEVTAAKAIDEMDKVAKALEERTKKSQSPWISA